MTPDDRLEPKSSHDAPIGGLAPPQFTIRTLLFVVAGLCIGLAIGRYLSPIANLAFILAVLTVVAHLAGAHFGHKLRSATDRARATWSPVAGPRPRVERKNFAAATRLGKRQSLGRPLVVCVALGTAIGLLGGWGLARFAYPDVAGIEHQAVSAIAFGALGAIVSLAIGGFVQTSIEGLLDAIRPPAKPDAPSEPTDVDAK